MVLFTESDDKSGNIAVEDIMRVVRSSNGLRRYILTVLSVVLAGTSACSVSRSWEQSRIDEDFSSSQGLIPAGLKTRLVI